MKHVIQCFVLFSAVVIVACVVALILPVKGMHANAIEGFQNDNSKMPTNAATAPSAASQPNLSRTAGSADGSSDHQHLLDNLLKKHDRLAEGFENRPSGSVSATTTQKGGIASRSADANANAGCSDKCNKIADPANAVRGTCVNPPISETNRNPDYSKKYCMAFGPKNTSIREQECATCGYYMYTAECLKRADPKNPTRCTKYGDYTPIANPYRDCSNNNPVCNLFLKTGDGSGTPDKSGPDCSAATCPAKEVTIPGVTTSTKKCVVPGCLSNNGGLPYPKDFYGNDMINPCKPHPNGNGYICPAVTFGSTTSYNSVGGSDDPCYTTNGKIDISKFQSMNQMPICNSVKLTPVQNFKPGTTDASNSGTSAVGTGAASTSTAATSTSGKGTSRAGKNTSRAGKSISTASGDNVVHVYHHYVNGKPKWSNTYKNPESGLIYLGIY